MKTKKVFLTLLMTCLASLPAVSAFPQHVEPKLSEKVEEKAEHSPRWAIRNGLDSGAKKIAHAAKSTTITGLMKMARPAKPPGNARVPSTETTLWQIEGDLVRYEKHDDGDIQFVLRDKAGSTLVCELPDLDEVRASPFIQEITMARSTFTKHFQPAMTTHVVRPQTVHLRITGLGYFGRVSNKDKPGLLNGAQLHPVTSVTVLSQK